MPGPLLVVMVPARNAAADLPGFLESVSRFADAVVALDDGSTDDTRDILAAHPLVRTLLTNPRRATYSGWDEPGDRARLLDAARDLEAQWVLWLDADERIAPDDGAALRAFVAPGGGADPACAYLLRWVRMIGDEAHYDQDHVHVGRLFAPRPEYRLPADRALHFVPLPTAIPRARWVTTTLRIEHLAALDAARREERFAKYAELDPDHRWQAIGYDHLLAGPGDVRMWRDRDPFQPVVAHAPVPDTRPLAPGEPALSVVVRVGDDESVVARGLDAVLAQVVAAPFEVVVVGDRDRTAAVDRDRFPDVTVVETGAGATPGMVRNAGIATARGRYVTFVDPHAELAPGSLAARLAAHRDGWAMVTGAVVHGGATRAGWAAYFLDHVDALPGRPSEVHPGAPVECSYPRVVVLGAGGFPEDRAMAADLVVAAELHRQGYGAYHEAAAVTYDRRPVRTVGDLVRHQYADGRARGRALATARPGAGSPGVPGPGGSRRFVVRSVPGRLRHVDRRVREDGRDLQGAYRRALPWVVVGAIASWTGGCVERFVRRTEAEGWWPWRRS